MKKIVSILATFAMLAVATPTLANDRFDPRWGNDRNVFSPYFGQHQINSRTVVIRDRRNRGVSTEGAIAIGVGALVLGSIIANNNNRRRDNDVVVVDRRYQQPRQVCRDIVERDYYGNPYVVDRQCWYER